MAIIIGDIHGDFAMAQAFLEYKPESKHVALGDYVDPRDPKITFEEELACLEILLDSGAELLWGNHDLSYTSEQLWHCSKSRLSQIKTLAIRYQTPRSRLKAAYGVDGWLCTHAGVSTACAHDLAAADAPVEAGDMNSLADWINAEFERTLAVNTNKCASRGPLFYVGYARGGTDKYGGIFWYDPRWEPSNPPDPRLMQIFGHTTTEGPLRKGNHINIHIEDGWWIFDTETDKFVRLRK